MFWACLVDTSIYTQHTVPGRCVVEGWLCAVVLHVAALWLPRQGTLHAWWRPPRPGDNALVSWCSGPWVSTASLYTAIATHGSRSWLRRPEVGQHWTDLHLASRKFKIIIWKVRLYFILRNWSFGFPVSSPRHVLCFVSACSVSVCYLRVSCFSADIATCWPHMQCCSAAELQSWGSPPSPQLINWKQPLGDQLLFKHFSSCSDQLLKC